MKYEEEIDSFQIDSLATYLLRDRGVEVIDSAIFDSLAYYCLDEIVEEFRVVSLLRRVVINEEILCLINKSESISKCRS